MRSKEGHNTHLCKQKCVQKCVQKCIILVGPPDLEPQSCFPPLSCAEKQSSSFRSEDEKVLRCLPPDQPQLVLELESGFLFSPRSFCANPPAAALPIPSEAEY